MTATKLRTGVAPLFEAQRNGDVKVTLFSQSAVISHLDTIRVAYWMVKHYVKAAAKRSDGPKPERENLLLSKTIVPAGNNTFA